MLARRVLGVTLSDPTSGFFAVRRDVFAALDDGTLRPEGFKILLSLYLEASRRAGSGRVEVREVEVPLRERVHGKSKLSGRVAWAYLRMLYRYRRRLRRPGPPRR
jgi:dolichol-phosphate mannosyltransferase